MGVSSSPAVTLLRQRYGNVTWDGILRGSGLLALTAIPVVLYSPRIGELVAFLLITLWVNGPLSPFLPTTYEPVLMLFGRVYPPILIGGLGILGTLYVEYLNYHLYQRVLGHSALKGMRRSNVIRGTIKLFQRAPFFTVWLCSWSPLPYWAVRFLSPMTGYPVRRHLVATFLGRFPRLWFFAALGLYWNISTRALVAISVGSIVAAVIIWTLKGRGAGPELDPGAPTIRLRSSEG